MGMFMCYTFQSRVILVTLFVSPGPFELTINFTYEFIEKTEEISFWCISETRILYYQILPIC
jgi:hypothetical protein